MRTRGAGAEGRGTDPPRPRVPGAAGLAGLLLPVACPGCGRPDHVVCPACRARLLRGPLRRRQLPDGTTVVAATSFRGPARGLVSAAKEQGRADVGAVLALALARAAATAGFDVPRRSPTLVLVPPPARPGAVLRRADRPTERLAADAARALRAAGADVRARGPGVPVLALARRVRDQAGLDRLARAENLDGAFRDRSRRWPAGPWPAASRAARRVDVLVVDDVLTTGATLAEAVRALRAGGAHVVGAAVVAAV